jgi:anti-sigma regulatory factor (Ser/Thr protein kinase)
MRQRRWGSEPPSPTRRESSIDVVEPGPLIVEAYCPDRRIVVIVTDEGRGWFLVLSAPGLGLGLPVIARLTQQVEISDRVPGTRMQMTFTLDALSQD